MTLTEKRLERLARITALGCIPPWWRFFGRRAWIHRFRAIMALDLSETAEILRSVYSIESIERLANQPSPSQLTKRPCTSTFSP